MTPKEMILAGIIFFGILVLEKPFKNLIAFIGKKWEKTH